MEHDNVLLNVIGLTCTCFIVKSVLELSLYGVCVVSKVLEQTLTAFMRQVNGVNNAGTIDEPSS